MARTAITSEGYENLKAELKRLSEVDRKQISKEIGIAREHGDLSENAEYHAAKERQGQIEARIRQLEGILSNAEIIDTTQLKGERVKFGARVVLEDVVTGKISEYRIVGTDEADISKGTISIASPLARALINHQIGDEITVKAPGGEKTYELSEIRWT
jgi:transcription elongation factor GreA